MADRMAKFQRFVLAEEERAVFAGHGAAAHGVHADLLAARADKALAAMDGRVVPRGVDGRKERVP